MKRLLLVMVLVSLLLALTPAVAHASPLVSNGDGEEETSSISEVIGILGVYTAMMLVLAVGAEVVIDAVRPIFGLKRKTSASEALGQVKEWLPGTLSELGASAEAQERINEALKELDELTTGFETQAEALRKKIYDELPDMLKDLAVHSVDMVVEKYWETELAPKVRTIPNLTEADAKAWVYGALEQLKATNAAEISTHLHAVSTLLETVQEQNKRLQGPARRFWRALRQRTFSWGEYVRAHWGGLGKVLSWVLFIPSYLTYAWTWLRNRLPDGDDFRARMKKLDEIRVAALTSVEDAAKVIFEQDAEQKGNENARIAWLRILSAVVGIALAASLRIDSFELLRPVLVQATTRFYYTAEVGGEEQDHWCSLGELIRGHGVCAQEIAGPALTPQAQAEQNFLQSIGVMVLSLTPGTILSGLGAAAGSAFWHDQLDKLRSAKQTVAQVEELASTMKGASGG